MHFHSQIRRMVGPPAHKAADDGHRLCYAVRMYVVHQHGTHHSRPERIDALQDCQTE